MKLISEIINLNPHEIVQIIKDENPIFTALMTQTETFKDAIKELKKYANNLLDECPIASEYIKEGGGVDLYEQIKWKGFATVRIKDYIKHEDWKFTDQNIRGEQNRNRPIKTIWNALRNDKIYGNADFYIDWLYLIRQLNNTTKSYIPKQKTILAWMDKHPVGTDKIAVEHRKKNKKRIIKVFVKLLSSGEITSRKYNFEPNDSQEDKISKVNVWWNDHLFHLQLAIRKPEILNEMLDYSLSEETMSKFMKAKEVGIPFFVNPYYLTLINVNEPDALKNTDLAIRDYVLYSQELIDEFGNIVAWEKEDLVQPGKPNAAGWILPSHHNVHRRYPEVAILIPDTVGRACAGLCVSCQRMYDFQSGHLNFDLEKLEPKETWNEKLQRLLSYYENDSHLRDILITGGDALMSSNNSLKHILDEVYQMAVRKREANKNRENTKKYAEILRVRLGTRIPVYLPQRINQGLIDVLKEFKDKASKIGIKQFVIQTHFESAMEITPEASEGIKRMISAGWMITNQHVFTTGSSRRGHASKLRKALNDIGVITYYTFSVKGYMENTHNFATNARAVQEQIQEKSIGIVPDNFFKEIKGLPNDAENMVKNISSIKKDANIPFLATDRNVLNMPGVGKSLSFRTIGLTDDGRRILEFEHDATREHSPIIHKMGNIEVIESKSISKYLRQIQNDGENIDEYVSIFGFSIGETEERHSVFEYPEYNFDICEEMTNIEIE